MIGRCQRTPSTPPFVDLDMRRNEMTGRAFRAMASTCLNEQEWHPDLIELQLAHAERNKVRGGGVQLRRAWRRGEG